MSALELLEALDALPRLGWVDAPSPVTALPTLAAELGLDWLGVKRDDQLGELFGGSKVRKLDRLLARQPFAEAPAWASVGAIGSGHLVALAAAARRLDRRLAAHLFWEPAIEPVLENLAFTASGPVELRYHETRVHLALRHPALVLGGRVRGRPVIAPGASTPAGIVGLVRAGVELALQIEDGVLPAPDRVYVALGSGGTAVGLALGLALAGRPIPVRAVAVVERPFALMRRLEDLMRETREHLVEAGIGLTPLAADSGARLEPVHGFLGAGYGLASPGARAAVDRLAVHGIALEPIYSGKAMDGLLAEASRGGRVLFWSTPRRAGPLPIDADWMDRLPPRLQDRLQTRPLAAGYTRRHVLALGGGLAAAGLAAVRLGGYPPRPSWTGEVLDPWEVHVLRAAVDAVLPPAPDGGAYDQVPANVDRYLRALPIDARAEIHGLMVLIEQATPLSGRVGRFSRLSPEGRREVLASLEARGGIAAAASRGLRDLVMLGYYQQPRAWAGLGYAGPLVDRGPRRPSAYDALVAPRGTTPRGWRT